MCFSPPPAANISKMGYCWRYLLFPHKMAVQFSLSLLRAGLWVVWTEVRWARCNEQSHTWAISGMLSGHFLVHFSQLICWWACESYLLSCWCYALAVDLDKKVVRKEGKLGSKEIAVLCICPVPTGTAEKASSGRLGFWIILLGWVGFGQFSPVAAWSLSAGESHARAWSRPECSAQIAPAELRAALAVAAAFYCWETPLGFKWYLTAQDLLGSVIWYFLHFCTETD